MAIAIGNTTTIYLNQTGVVKSIIPMRLLRKLASEPQMPDVQNLDVLAPNVIQEKFLSEKYFIFLQ